MSFERPTLKQLVERMEDDAQSRLNVTQLRRSNSKVYVNTLAGALHSLYGYMEFMHRQQFFDTAEAEYLDRWSSIYGIKRKPSTKASGKVKFRILTAGTNIPAGTALQSDFGAVYETTEGVNSDGVANVVALESGEQGNLEKGEVLKMISPIAGVFSEATCEGIAGGTQAEGDDELRRRLLKRVQETPHGGTESDYVQWALEVPGVTRAWCFPMQNGAGTVTIRFVCDKNSSILPTEEMLRKVQAYLDTKRPVTVTVNVAPVELQPVNITIESLTPDTSDVKEAVRQELSDLFARESRPGGLVYLSHIRAAISAALGEEDHTLIAPTANPVAATNKILVLGEITWQ